MNIVFLHDDFPPESKGGAGNLAGTLARALVAEGHQVTVIAATQKRENEGKSIWEGIPVHRIYTEYHERWRAYVSLYNPATISKVESLLAELKPDVVHAHNVHQYLSYYTLMLAKRHAKKVVLTAHDEMLFHYGKFYECIGSSSYKIHWWQIAQRFTKRYNPFRTPLIRLMVRGVTIVAISKTLQQALADNGVESKVIYNGMDVAGWPASNVAISAFKETHGLEDKKVILFAGRISVLKGFREARAMFDRVRAAHPEARLLVAGAVQEPLPGVVYTGWLAPEQMKAAYGASDVVIFPSIYFDPFGLVNIEAGAAGKPVVATSFGGAHEIVEDGKTGYVGSPFDTDWFSEKVAFLLEHPEVARAFGEAGHTRVLAHFTAAQMAKSYVSLYNQHP